MTQTFLKFGAGLGLVALLAACGGSGSNSVSGELPGSNPVSTPEETEDFGLGTGEEVSTDGIPDALALNLKAASYDSATETLVLTVDAFDDGVNSPTYLRNAALDANGYLAFSVQDDPLDRMFVSLVGAGEDNVVNAVVVSDGGQFGISYGGGSYTQDGSLVLPTEGLVTFAGNYAAITDTGLDGTSLLPVPAGTPSALRPAQPASIQGDIFLNVDFSDTVLNGLIYNRAYTNQAINGSAQFTDVLLTGTIASDGTFEGTTSAPVNAPDSDVGGTFGGTFGGDGATDLAGVTHLTSFSDTLELEDEYGVFVLEQCATSGSPICAGLGE